MDVFYQIPLVAFPEIYHFISIINICITNAEAYGRLILDGNFARSTFDEDDFEDLDLGFFFNRSSDINFNQ